MSPVKVLKKNYLILLIFLVPISLVVGPFVAELNIFFIIIFSIINYSKYYNKNLLSKEIIFLIFFNIFLIINSLFSDHILHSLKSSVPYFRFILYSLGVYLILCETKTKNTIIFKLLLVYSLIFLCVDGIFQNYFGYNFFLMTDDSSPKISGLFGDEKILGSYLVRCLPFIIFILLKTKKKYLNIFICFFLFSITIILSGERSSVLLLLPVIFFTTIYFSKFVNKKKLIIFFLSYILFITLLVFNNLEVKKRYIDLTLLQLNKVDKSLEKNIEEEDKHILKEKFFLNQYFAHYYSSYKMFLDKKLIGHGPNNFRKICSNEKYFFNVLNKKDMDNVEITELVPQGSCSTHPHNIYAQFLSELGLIGLCFLIFAQLFFLKELYYAYKNGSKYFFVILTLIISLWPFATSGNFFNNWLSILYFFPLGFYLFYKQNTK